MPATYLTYLVGNLLHTYPNQRRTGTIAIPPEQLSHKGTGQRPAKLHFLLSRGDSVHTILILFTFQAGQATYF